MIFEPDKTIEGADWIKRDAWDLPPYKSLAFFAAIGGEDKLHSFKQTPSYRSALEHGDIYDDEWIADYTAAAPGLARHLPARSA